MRQKTSILVILSLNIINPSKDVNSGSVLTNIATSTIGKFLMA